MRAHDDATVVEMIAGFTLEELRGGRWIVRRPNTGWNSFDSEHDARESFDWRCALGQPKQHNGDGNLHGGGNDCPVCTRIQVEGFGPSHNGSRRCASGSLASGGKYAHCTCDTCF